VSLGRPPDLVKVRILQPSQRRRNTNRSVSSPFPYRGPITFPFPCVFFCAMSSLDCKFRPRVFQGVGKRLCSTTPNFPSSSPFFPALPSPTAQGHFLQRVWKDDVFLPLRICDHVSAAGVPITRCRWLSAARCVGAWPISIFSPCLWVEISSKAKNHVTSLGQS